VTEIGCEHPEIKLSHTALHHFSLQVCHNYHHEREVYRYIRSFQFHFNQFTVTYDKTMISHNDNDSMLQQKIMIHNVYLDVRSMFWAGVGDKESSIIRAARSWRMLSTDDWLTRLEEGRDLLFSEW